MQCSRILIVDNIFSAQSLAVHSWAQGVNFQPFYLLNLAVIQRCQERLGSQCGGGNNEVV